MKTFVKNDEGFICINCKKEVKALGYTSRNHCPYCLHSLHVDINPGDRMNECRGVLEPIQAIPDAKKGMIIVFKCKKCGKVVRNKAALREDGSGDSVPLLIKLTAGK